ncbi:multi-sensor signal transduction histidine kinase [Pseudomonas saudimassiliensis]|uniref:histidine kinase n=1 Tax=Pseudomonas saudimassiliensis TaxID=1461581 RepID=A0A078MJA6_9PSED|nr:ATP-binding protein [Pseudomonas saudimassiliensis]CEA04791.1 multi-sensor signal transduction histidine kinase [Pseudomonas saudimassiliensis]CEF26798.1 multi-sensor signal transduction histidine kinase [Pseudomonas saudimassiliensis]
MKLRSRLFLSNGALLTVALIGLLLGIFSVLHLTRAQNQAMTSSLLSIEAAMGLSQELNSQLALLLAEEVDLEALRAADMRFDALLDQARRAAREAVDREALEQLTDAYAAFETLLAEPLTVRGQMLGSAEFRKYFSATHERLDGMLKHHLQQLSAGEQHARERAWLIAGLLGLVGAAVLVLGLITAHSIAERFGRPIEALAHAANLIGKGDFRVTLPVTSVAELATLSRRFGLMAAALQQFRNSDVEALMAEQRRLQAVLDSIDDGLLIFDRSGRLEHFNPVAGRQLGCDVRQLGLRASEALQRPELDEQLWQVARGGDCTGVLGDLQVQVHDESRLLTYSITPVRHPGGRLLGMVMVLHDVTEQRAFERIRSEFVLRASHELRTPVAGMHMAFALLLERLQFSPESREGDLLRTVDEEMHRLVRLISELLDFSRYQNGLQTLERSPCDIAELLTRARERFIGQAEEKDLTLTVEHPTDLPQAQLDRLQIERVLDNLLANAIRHSHPGGTVRLAAGRQDDYLLLAVEDDGEGVPYGQQTRIFEPFVQIGASRGGAGLGLALCREIVQLHGGQIILQSHPGRGARFQMLLPLV